MSASLFVLMTIIISIATAYNGVSGPEWYGEDLGYIPAPPKRRTLRSDNNATITMICATYGWGFYTSISAYFSDHHAAHAGSPGHSGRNCTERVSEGECFTSVYVTYDEGMIRGLQLRTSDHKLLSYHGTVMGANADIASGKEGECLTEIGYYNNVHFAMIQLHFQDNFVSDLEEVVSDASDLQETGWSQWIGSGADEFSTLKSPNNASVTQLCGTFPLSYYCCTPGPYYTSFSAYFADNYADFAGSPRELERRCTNIVNEGECIHSVYVTYDCGTSLCVESEGISGITLMTSNDTLFEFFGATIWLEVDPTANAGRDAVIVSGKPHECLTGIGIGVMTEPTELIADITVITQIRFYFGVASDLEDVDSDPLEYDVSETTQISTTQISTTQRTSTTIKQQAIVVQIDGESFNMQSNDWSETSSILSAGMIVINVGICAMIMVYKMYGHRSQARNDEEKLVKIIDHRREKESFEVDLKIEDAVTKKGDGETLEIALPAATPKKKKKKGKKKRSMSTH